MRCPSFPQQAPSLLMLGGTWATAAVLPFTAPVPHLLPSRPGAEATTEGFLQNSTLTILSLDAGEEPEAALRNRPPLLPPAARFEAAGSRSTMECLGR